MLNIERLLSNIKKILPIAALPVALSSCTQAQPPHPMMTAYSEIAPQTRIAPIASVGSTMVCRNHQCTPASLNMTKGHVMNNIHKLLANNIGQDVFFCEADDISRSCLNDFIEYPMLVGATPGTMRLDRARLLDAKATNVPNKVEFVLDYNFYFNGIKAQCNPSVNVAYAKSPDYIVMEDTETTCHLTTNYSSKSSHLYTVDFIDLDYGMIGAYYSFGMSGVAYGGKGGYMIMRFPNGVKFPTGSLNNQMYAPAQAAAPVIISPVIENSPVILQNNPYPRNYYSNAPYAPYSNYNYRHAPKQRTYIASEHHKDANSITRTKNEYTHPHNYSKYYPGYGYPSKPMYHTSYDHIPLATSK
ncbi:MAG: hypothetical protein GY804_11075 [Alphaproteobacteria bacterium]|nr:hypothetical protein [Alphaproteobacteria bacterium]